MFCPSNNNIKITKTTDLRITIDKCVDKAHVHCRNQTEMEDFAKKYRFDVYSISKNINHDKFGLEPTDI